MNNSIYEKVVTGKNLNEIFDFDVLENVENYLIHIESVEDTRNNYIMSMEDNSVEVQDVHVTSTNLSDLKLV